MNFESETFAHWVDVQRESDPFYGVVHLSRGEEVLFASGYGDALRSESIPNRLHTRFQMASGSKIFTSVAVCQLMERGLLTPRTSLSECLDVDFPHFDPGVTVHHLLTHTSGIPDYFDEETMDDYEGFWATLPTYAVRSPSDFLPLFRDRPMKFPPGERFSYSNAGFILLGLIVEELTGESFTDYVEAQLFARAGMQDSGYFWMDRLPERTAYAYIEEPDGTWRTNFFAVPIVGGGDGGAYTTAPDMVRFWGALRERRLLGEDLTQQLLTPHIATGWEAPYTHYGYGVWIHADERGVQRWFVVGADPGVSFKSSYFPQEEVVLTFIGNAGETLWSFARALEERLGI